MVDRVDVDDRQGDVVRDADSGFRCKEIRRGRCEELSCPLRRECPGVEDINNGIDAIEGGIRTRPKGDVGSVASCA
jgi:hypothetical protein